jgi:hypothetical protein
MPSPRVRIDALRHACMVNTHLRPPVPMPKSIRQRHSARHRHWHWHRLGDRREVVARAKIPVHVPRIELALQRWRPSLAPVFICPRFLAHRLASPLLRLGRSQKVRAASARAGWGGRRGGRCASWAGAYGEVGGGASIWRKCVVRVCEGGECRERAVERRAQYDACVGVGAGRDANTCDGRAPRALTCGGKEGLGRGRGRDGECLCVRA